MEKRLIIENIVLKQLLKLVNEGGNLHEIDSMDIIKAGYNDNSKFNKLKSVKLAIKKFNKDIKNIFVKNDLLYVYEKNLIYAIDDYLDYINDTYKENPEQCEKELNIYIEDILELTKRYVEKDIHKNVVGDIVPETKRKLMGLEKDLNKLFNDLLRKIESLKN